MPQSYQEYSSGLTATTYSVTFKYLTIDDVHALGFDGSTWTSLALHASTPRDATNKTITLAAAPSSYTKIRLYRATSNTTLVDFQNGSRLSEADLDTAYQQGLFVAQEVAEDANTNQFNAVRDSSILTGTNLSNFANQAFTSTAGQTEFTLTNFIPQTTAPEAFVVSIDGVIQAPSAYTISMSPAKITFSSGVPLSAIVVVVTGVAAASATSVDDSTLEIVTATNKARVKDGGITPAKLSTTGEYTVAGLTVDNGSNDGGQLRLSSQGYNQMYFDNHNGNLRVINNDATTDVGTEVMRIDPNGLIKLRGQNTDFSDWWGNTHTPAIFTPHGFLGSNGSYAVSIFCNGYRNTSGGFTSLGVDGKTEASGIELFPHGDIVFRTGTPSGTSVPEALRLDTNGRLILKNTDEVRLFTTDALYSGIKLGGNSSNEGAVKMEYNRTSGGFQIYNGLNAATEQLRLTGAGHFTVMSSQTIAGNLTVNTNLTVSGHLQYGTIAAASDRKLKENIEELTNSLDKICQLNGKSYTMISDETSKKRQGFIAQEVQEVFPEIVVSAKKEEDEEETFGLMYIELIAPMVEAIKELKSKNESLQARVEELESSQTKIESLEARVEALENA